MINNISIEGSKLVISTNLFGQNATTRVDISDKIIRQKENLSSYENKIEDKEFKFILDNFLNILKCNPEGYFSNENGAKIYLYYPSIGGLGSPMKLTYIYEGRGRAFEMKISEIDCQFIELKEDSYSSGFNLDSVLSAIKIIKELELVSDKDYKKILTDALNND